MREIPSRQSDSELLLIYRREQSMQCIAELYKRYAHLVMGMCIKYLKDREEARDAVSQVFEKLITELKVREIQNFPGWLGFVTRNHCISLLRKKGSLISREKEFASLHEEDMETWPEPRLLEDSFPEDALEKAIGELKEEQQVCIRLFYLEKRSYVQVAEQTGMELKAVKSHLQNGKRNLKLILEKNAHIPR